MKNKWLKTIIAFVITAVAVLSSAVIFMPTQSAMANSADRNFFGENSQGIILTDEDCPIVVDKEVLTFDIYKNEPKSNGMTFASSQNDSENTGFYKKQVSAEYTFRNPSENTITANLVFPFGFYSRYYAEKTDISLYGISVNDTVLDCNLRATYCENAEYYDWSNTIDLEDMRENLLDDYKEDEFYKPDKSVTAYSLTFSSAKSLEKCVLCLDWKGLDVKSIVSGQYMYYDYKNGVRTKFVCQMSSYKEDYTFYVIDNAVSQDELLNRIKVYTDFDLQDEVGTVVACSAQSLSVKDLFLYHREEDCLISEVDWYNIVLRCVTRDFKNGVGIENVYSLNIEYYMLCWFEYDLTFAPGETLTNKVSAPIYPDENGWFVPSKYKFNYFLSPAFSWADFNDLSVVINTDMYLIDNQIEDIESGEGYYAWHYDTLPDGELSFTLCEVEEPSLFRSGAETIVGIGIIMVCVGVGLAILFPIVGVIIVVVVVKKKNKNSNK